MSIIHKIRRGVDIPLGGKPTGAITDGESVTQVALLGRDYHGMKPRLMVHEGDSVKLGQPLFSDKKQPSLLYTSPASGRIDSINRGERRAFISIVINLDGENAIEFPSFDPCDLQNIPRERVEEILLQSGLWTSFRTRPFSMIPNPGAPPAAIFVTAIDTDPVPLDPVPVIEARREEFHAGLAIMRIMTDGPLFLCHSPGVSLPIIDGVTAASFAGPHPAGIPGTHIHLLHPVDIKRTVWQIGFQDLIAIGSLFLLGRIDSERIVAIGGPMVNKPRPVRTRIGANLNELMRGELLVGTARVISGSPLSGHAATETPFLGRYHNSVSVLPEGGERHFLSWLTGVFAPFLKQRSVSTDLHGSRRALVPIGAFEKVMPLDLQITWLLRSLLADELETAVQLGCLELDEEDLALCSYVCPSKIDYGMYLRRMLDRIRQEGV